MYLLIHYSQNKYYRYSSPLLEIERTFSYQDVYKRQDEHCEEIKALQDYDIEIAGSAPGAPFWDVGYDEQREIMIKTKEGIEACTGKKMRIFSSKYFAYTEDTIKIAEELGIEYVFARGTTCLLYTSRCV